MFSSAGEDSAAGFGWGNGGELPRLIRGASWGLENRCWVGVREMPDPVLQPGFLCGGDGPSSTTQSLRSMSDVLRPKLGGEGDGDGDVR